VTRVGTVISLPDVALAELAGAALDFAWIDLEHGALCVRDAQALAIALTAAGCEAHVRLPDAASEALGPVLDAGVDGVVLPRVEDAEAARRIVQRLRYPPAGTRGFGPRRAGAYGRVAAPWAPAEARVTCTVQIETPAGVEAAAEIAAVEGVDAIVLGCADLSLALDAPQDLSSRPLADAADRVAAAAAAAGTRFGLAAGGAFEEIAALAGSRADHVVFSADVRLYSRAVDAAMNALTAALDGAHAAA
jgi:4-hydroxy-2-oxoheptanedioate aldolase